MESFLNIRKTIKDFFDRYDLYIMPCLKFLLAFFTFIMINRTLSYFDALNNAFILIILSLLCAILPVNAIAVIGIVLIILQCFAANLIIGIVALCFFVLLLILLLRFVPKEMLWVILTPFAFLLNIPAAIPVSLGMVRNRASIAAGIGGIATYCFLSELPGIASQVSLGRITQIEAVQQLIRSFIGHEELLLSSIVFTAVILIVYLIRKMVTNYTYLIAVVSGCAFYIILRIFGRIYLQTSGSISRDLVGTLLSAVICLVIAFFWHCADYKRTQVLQFEDDEYYYYVRAVPKRTPDTPDEYDDDLAEELFNEDDFADDPDEEYPYEDEVIDPVYTELQQPEESEPSYADPEPSYAEPETSYFEEKPAEKPYDAYFEDDSFDPDISDFDDDPEDVYNRYNR